MKWFLLAILLSKSGIQDVEILEVHSSEKTCIQRVLDAKALSSPSKVNFVCCPSKCELFSLVL